MTIRLNRIALASCVALMLGSATAGAEPLLTQGIGTSSCARLKRSA